MSGSIDVPISEIRPLDFVHWTSPRCPGDNYQQVIAIAPNTDLIVIYRGIRKTIKLSQVTSAVRNEPIQDKRGQLLSQSRVWGKGTT